MRKDPRMSMLVRRERDEKKVEESHSGVMKALPLPRFAGGGELECAGRVGPMDGVWEKKKKKERSKARLPRKESAETKECKSTSTWKADSREEYVVNTRRSRVAQTRGWRRALTDRDRNSRQGRRAKRIKNGGREREGPSWAWLGLARQGCVCVCVSR